MVDPRALTLTLLALCSGCVGVATAAPSAHPPLRLLSSEPAMAPRPEVAPYTNGAQLGREVTLPRIGAPGGSGAGSRRVTPVQSGKETVGGLPVGMAGGTGPRG